MLNEGKTPQNGIKINYSCLPETGKEMVLLSYFVFQSIGLVASGFKQTSHSPLRFLENFFLSHLQGLDLLHAADKPFLFLWKLPVWLLLQTVPLPSPVSCSTPCCRGAAGLTARARQGQAQPASLVSAQASV